MCRKPHTCRSYIIWDKDCISRWTFLHILLCCFLCWVFGGCLYSCCLNASGLCQVILPGHFHLACVASTDCKKRFWSLLWCSYKTSMFSEVTVPNIMCIVSFVLVFTLVKGANWLFLSSVQFWHFLWKKCCTIAPIFKAFHGSNSGKHFICPVMESEIWCEKNCSVFPKFWFLCWSSFKSRKASHL